MSTDHEQDQIDLDLAAQARRLAHANPFGHLGTNVGASAEPYHGTEPLDSMEATWDEEVDSAEATAIQKRNMAPAGTYISDPDTWAPSITKKVREDENMAGEVTGQRRVATVFMRATVRTREGQDITQLLRFDVSPEARKKKVYSDGTWTGEVDDHKDDITTRLWADAVKAYEAHYGPGRYSQAQVLAFLSAVPVAVRCMQGDRGELVVLGLSLRGRNRG